MCVLPALRTTVLKCLASVCLSSANFTENGFRLKAQKLNYSRIRVLKHFCLCVYEIIPPIILKDFILSPISINATYLFSCTQ